MTKDSDVAQRKSYIYPKMDGNIMNWDSFCLDLSSLIAECTAAYNRKNGEESAS